MVQSMQNRAAAFCPDPLRIHEDADSDFTPPELNTED